MLDPKRLVAWGLGVGPMYEVHNALSTIGAAKRAAQAAEDARESSDDSDSSGDSDASEPDITDFTNARTVAKYADKGDLIEFDRGAYNHWGVCIGHKELIHFSGEPTDKSSAVVRLDKITEVAAGDRCRVNNQFDNKPNFKVRRRKQIRRYAKSQLGEKGYNLAFNNCEHFATYCRYGRGISAQTWVLLYEGAHGHVQRLSRALQREYGIYSN
ncbi:unnamed protein product [Rotaria magnacalcarata]